jgi:hypothetical protein
MMLLDAGRERTHARMRMTGTAIISWLGVRVNGTASINEVAGRILDKVRTMSEENPTPDSARVEALRSKATAGHKLSAEERLELFDAGTKWIDELQAEQLKEARAKGTSVTRENRGWTREDLYNDDRGLPRGFPRGR